jgi:hypothetical protein
MLGSYERNQFNDLRLEYLATGRAAMVYLMLWAGAINLGYAVESYLNQGMLELGIKKNIIQNSHDLRKKLKECRKLGLYKSVDSSNDFLQYVEWLFNMRYPTSFDKYGNFAYEIGKAISIDSATFHLYDDLICQLDDDLRGFVQSHSVSTLVRAAAISNEIKAKLIFYYNAPALSRLAEFTEIVERNFTTNFSAISELHKGENYFWNYFKLPDKNYMSFDGAKNFYQSKNFKFPGKVVRNSKGVVTKIIFS